MTVEKQIDYNRKELPRKIKKGIAWSAIQALVINISTILVTAVVVRILSPDDFGLFGMTLTLVAFIQIFSDCGLGLASVQKDYLKQRDVESLFTIGIVLGSFLWLISVFLANPISVFYGREELKQIIVIVGVVFLLHGMTVQPIAILHRDMRHQVVSKVEIIATIIGGISGVVLAVNGLSYWSLVFQLISYSLTKSVLLIYISGIKIKYHGINHETINLIKFGCFMMVTSLIIYFSRNLDSILIGKNLGAEELGIYNRAYFLMLLPSTLVTTVVSSLMFTTLSANKNNKKEFSEIYQRSLILIAYIGFPISVGLILIINEAVLLIYGEAWSSVVPIFMALSAAVITQPMYNTNGWVFSSLGKKREYLIMTTGNVIVLTVAFIYAIDKGLETLALYYSIVMGVCIFITTMCITHKVAGILILSTVKKVLRITPPLIVMIISVEVTDYIIQAIELNWVMNMIAKIAVGVIAYLLASFLMIRSFFEKEVLIHIRGK